MQKEVEMSALKDELVLAKSKIQSLEDEKKLLEKSIKAGQVQKEMFYDETDMIHNVQQQEIIKLKSMLLFREQVGWCLVIIVLFVVIFGLSRNRWIIMKNRKTTS